MFESTWMFSSFSLIFCLSSRSTFCPTVLFVHVLVGVGFLPRGAPPQPVCAWIFPLLSLRALNFGLAGGSEHAGGLDGYEVFSCTASGDRTFGPIVRQFAVGRCTPQRLAAACTDVSRGRPCILDILGHLSRESWRHDVGVRRSLVKNDNVISPPFKKVPQIPQWLV